ncbi:hypothetical protein M405DRAFT_861488 [Rhizopogon salebrosus TDB-379]|nr:hypothetical protein M405DRAFT_861488 [Rhizopogon salebrosus TDB-379]
MLPRLGEVLDQKFLSLKQFCQTQFENSTNLIFTMRLLTFIIVCVAFLAVSATAQDTPDGGDGSDGGDQPDSGDGP